MAESLRAVEKVIPTMMTDGDNPVSIAIMDSSGKLILLVSMDGAIPISVELAQKKAFTALQIESNTLEWELQGVDPANLGEKYTLFGGGALITNTKGDKIIGSVGVSGRNSYRKVKNEPLQDAELAQLIAEVILEIIREREN